VSKVEWELGICRKPNLPWGVGDVFASLVLEKRWETDTPPLCVRTRDRESTRRDSVDREGRDFRTVGQTSGKFPVCTIGGER